MSKVEEIQKTFAQLPPEQQREVARWISEFQNDAWDRQMEEDAKAGRLDFLLERAKEDLRAGRTRPLP